MIRKIKALGLTIVACLAMSAVAASGAQAVEFHSSVEHTIISGTQIGNHVFTVGGGFGNITCKKATFSGTGTKKTTSAQTMVPDYTECTESAFGTKAEVTCLSCGYNFTPNAGDIDVEGEFLVHTGTGCTISIKAQTIEKGTVYHNKESAGIKDILVTSDTTNEIDTTTSGGFFACGIGNGAHSEGSYTGETTVTATDTEGKPVSTWVE